MVRGSVNVQNGSEAHPTCPSGRSVNLITYLYPLPILRTNEATYFCRVYAKLTYEAAKTRKLSLIRNFEKFILLFLSQRPCPILRMLFRTEKHKAFRRTAVGVCSPRMCGLSLVYELSPSFKGSVRNS
jgi:hypothetical protein